MVLTKRRKLIAIAVAIGALLGPKAEALLNAIVTVFGVAI